MKSYTDLEQSKKLAEILPLESADMFHAVDAEIVITTPYITYINDERYIPGYKGAIPCWSLAALLDVLPLGIETHKQTDGDKIYYYVETYMKCMGKETYLSTERHENLIDACFELIIKLHELKKL